LEAFLNGLVIYKISFSAPTWKEIYSVPLTFCVDIGAKDLSSCLVWRWLYTEGGMCAAARLIVAKWLLPAPPIQKGG
jgi:hypothetical protein